MIQHCCNKTLRVEDVDICSLKIKVYGTAPSAGEYTLNLNFLSSKLIIKKTFAINAAMEFDFPSGLLNENYDYYGFITNSVCELVQFVKGGVTYDCIVFATKLVTNA